MRSVAIKSLLPILPVMSFGCAMKSDAVGTPTESSAMKSRVEDILLLYSQLPDADVKDFGELDSALKDASMVKGGRNVASHWEPVP